MAGTQVQVAATKWRPAFLPLFVLSRNNLNPAVWFDDQALHVKVVTSNALPWSTISSVKVEGGKRVIVHSGSSHYILHFRDPAELEVLVNGCREREIPIR